MALDPAQELAALYRGVALQVEQLAREYEARGAQGSAAVTTRQLQSIEQAVQRLDAGTAAWIRQNITELYIGTIPEALASIDKAGVPLVSTGFTGHDRRAVRALEERYARELGTVRDAIGVGLITGDRRQARERIRRAVEEEGFTTRMEDGRLSVKVPSGKYWKPEVYAEMLGRTSMAATRRVSFRERYLQNGVDVVRVVPNGTVHDVCLYWEGELLSLTGATKGLATVDQARATGLFHPNCAHRYVVATNVEQPEVPERRMPVAAPKAPLRTLGLKSRTGARRRTRPPRRLPPARTTTPRAAAAAPLAGGLPKAAGSFDPTKSFDPGMARKMDNMQPWYKTQEHTIKQSDGVNTYGGAGYGPINSALRNPDPEQRSMARRSRLGSSTLGEHVDAIDEAIRNTAPLAEDLTLYRGVKTKGRSIEALKNMRVGKEFTDYGYSSWSGERSTATTFSEQNGVTMRMRAPAGSKALYVSSVEEELLFKRGAKYRVVDVEKKVPMYQSSPGGFMYTQTVVTVELVGD